MGTTYLISQALFLKGCILELVKTSLTVVPAKAGIQFVAAFFHWMPDRGRAGRLN